jgi:gamma-tubulin complex component 3
VFQGIDGQYIQFELLADAYVLSPQVSVSPSTYKLVQELCELGWLFRKVSEWLTRNGKDRAISQVVQSLCFSIQGELAEYYRLLAVLESQRNQYQPEDAANYLNLRKLYLWV